MLNQIMLIGNLGRDAEAKTTTDGTPLISFTVATSRGKDKEPIWWRVTFWGDRAKQVAEFNLDRLKKGNLVWIQGEYDAGENGGPRTYVNKDGQVVPTLDVRGGILRILMDRNSSGSEGDAAPPPRQQTRQSTPSERPPVKGPRSRF